MTSIKMLVSAFAFAAVAGSAQARDQIRIVGSSTVFPFSTAVAEQFGRSTDFATPVVESTGSGGGMKLFCAGVGTEHPDMTNASRQMKASEFKLCQDNGVADITEVVVGYDGIVVANAKGAPAFELTRQQLHQALSAYVLIGGKIVANPNTKWSDIDPALPDANIEVLGPPPSSGTRDAFEELALGGGAKKIAALKELRSTKVDDPRLQEIITELAIPEELTLKNGELTKGKNIFKKIAHAIREDGFYIDAGENDNLIVSKLGANPNALGVFGFSFLDQNSDKIQGSTIGGIEPSFDAIADGDYPVSRSLYFYIKQAHVGVIPGIQEYAAEFMSEDAAGEDGYLADKGLIPLLEDAFEKYSDDVANLAPMTGEDLQ